MDTKVNKVTILIPSVFPKLGTVHHIDVEDFATIMYRALNTWSDIPPEVMVMADALYYYRLGVTT